jgi:hypothetical protein
MMGKNCFHDMLDNSVTAKETRSGEGLSRCRQAAMIPSTANGNALSIPTARKASGKKTRASSINTAAIKKLHHHGERNKIANSDFSDIFNFIERSACSNSKDVI